MCVRLLLFGVLIVSGVGKYIYSTLDRIFFVEIDLLSDVKNNIKVNKFFIENLRQLFCLNLLVSPNISTKKKN